jgi:acetylglutamate kinase
MDRVGRIVKVREDILLEFCEQGVIPVISPISIGPDGRYNVNADHAAGAIAGAVKAPRVVFLSNVSGVQVSKKVVSTLSRNEAHKLIQQGVIHDGMIPKVYAALDALSQGAQEVIITDLRGLRAGSGTKFVN